MVSLFLFAGTGVFQEMKRSSWLKFTEELSLPVCRVYKLFFFWWWAMAKITSGAMLLVARVSLRSQALQSILFQIFRPVGTTGCLSILHFEPHTTSFTAVNTWWGGRSLLWVLLFLGSLFNGLLKQFQQTNIKATAFVPHWECIHLAFFEAISLWECLCAVVAPLVLVTLKCAWQHSA